MRRSAMAAIVSQWTRVKRGAVKRSKTYQNYSKLYAEIKEEMEIKRASILKNEILKKIKK